MREPMFTGQEGPEESMRRRGQKCRRVRKTQEEMSFQSTGVVKSDK